jgi:ABC-2 type transport system ATP-binding protein
MSHDIVVDDVHLRYGETEALRGLSFELPAGTICGLLGRNGSGKTSLLSLIAARRRPSAGRITVGGVDPFENAAVMSRVALVGEAGGGSLHDVDDVRRLGRQLRPTWDDAYAGRLLDRFGVRGTSKVSALSRGQRAALAATCGLASGAAVTMFDEAHLGMDAPSRAAFYDELLDGVISAGRTVILSTHHIDEVAALFGEVVIIDAGRLVVHAETDSLRGQGTEVTGPAEAVDAFTAGLTVLGTRQLGGTKAAVVHGELGDGQLGRAADLHVELGPLPLQDLFIHLTEQPASHDRAGERGERP